MVQRLPATLSTWPNDLYDVAAVASAVENAVGPTDWQPLADALVQLCGLRRRTL